VFEALSSNHLFINYNSHNYIEFISKSIATIIIIGDYKQPLSKYTFGNKL